MEQDPAHRIQTVPEHSVAFMKAASGGEALFCDGFLFLFGKDWLIAIGYPLQGEYDSGAFAGVLETVISERNPDDCWAIAPELPPSLASYVTEMDEYYVLSSDSPVPRGLRGPLAKATQSLRLEEGRDFTADHRKLWAEFLRHKTMKLQVREMFARTSVIVNAPETDIRLLNAWNAEGKLAACLVMDCGPEDFDSYVIGAHSRTAYIPHASDALFAYMLESARVRGKRYIHLGLGVNEGITRFKTKWGGRPAMPYQAAAWKAGSREMRAPGTYDSDSGSFVRDALYRGLLSSSRNQHGRKRYDDAEMTLFGKRLPPEQRPYAMLWKLTKNGKTSWIGGTAHSFRYSFAAAFRSLFAGVDTVIFEGPLDAASLAAFGSHGRTRDADSPRVIEYFHEEEICRLERVVRGPQGAFAKFLNMAWHSPADVRGILSSHRPWSVFFTLYYSFLERHGWNQSVDLEAWEIAHDMERDVIGMESIDEQIAALESVPMERIINFLRRPEDWKHRMRQSLSAYLDGDLARMLNTGTEFPTRTTTVIALRDQRFRERMLPYIEAGRAAVFVGSAHMLNLGKMLREDGFTVTQAPPTWRRKLRECFKKIG